MLHPEESLTRVLDESRQGESYVNQLPAGPSPKKFYMESYGCQMNFADSEVIASILTAEGFGPVRHWANADLILLNTCAIREKAEQTVRTRLQLFREAKRERPGLLIGLLGCMAERLKSQLLEEELLVDIVVGPDAYRSLPLLIQEAESGQKAVNVLLSREETYADIAPVRLEGNGINAYISIMRGCDNMCSFCVVPFTRGRERSRDTRSILQECRSLFQEGYREVTLLGQNVDSYMYEPSGTEQTPGTAGKTVSFAGLLDQVARISSQLRVRFSTSHPKDLSDDVLFTMARHENICKNIHLPVQSGSSRILQLMNRTYNREWYQSRLKRIRDVLPECGLSTDIIAGFCSESEEEHRQTLSLMEESGFDMSYMFCYSERPGTLAARRYRDDITDEVKKRRLGEIVSLQNRLSLESNRRDIGKSFQVLVEGDSRKSQLDWKGRNSQNKVVVFPKQGKPCRKGEYVNTVITGCTQTALLGSIV